MKRAPLTRTKELAPTELRRGSPLTRSVPSSVPLRSTGTRNTGSRAGDFAAAGRAVPESKSAARRRAARYTGPSPKIRRFVLERDGYACVCCGRSVIGQVYSLQHRKRRSRGGGNSPSNLVTVLGDGTTGCHQRIDSRIDPADEAKGYTVRSWQDPAQIPVMVFSEHGSGMTVWLSETGTYLLEAPEGAEAA